MNDLDISIDQAVPWFTHEKETPTPYILVRVSEDDAKSWIDKLAVAFRQCYVTDAVLEERAATLTVPKSEILASVLPDAGSTMSGDFGELIVFIYHGAKASPQVAIGPKKWRLKQDRTKPAPYSDVIHFVVPHWPTATTDDIIFCSEVKTKSTESSFNPITEAIAGCEKDRISRLAKTLVWLKERSMREDLGSVAIEHLDRFIKATDYPTAKKVFRAVVVICTSLVDDELGNVPSTLSPDCILVIISVPQLQKTYTSVFDAVRATLTTT
jgi:hypothetical protein